MRNRATQKALERWAMTDRQTDGQTNRQTNFPRIILRLTRWRARSLPTVAGDVVQAVPRTDRSINFVGQQRISCWPLERSLVTGHSGWRCGPRRLRANDDDDDVLSSLTRCVWST